jgi:hypothetical protein
VHLGIIGTGDGIEKAVDFYTACSAGVDGDDTHPPFPGCRPGEGYRMTLRTPESLHEKLTQAELREVLEIRGGKERFLAGLELLKAKLRVLTERDHPLDYVAVVIPPELRKRCGVADYHERGVGPSEVRVIKSIASFIYDLSQFRSLPKADHADRHNHSHARRRWRAFCLPSSPTSVASRPGPDCG